MTIERLQSLGVEADSKQALRKLQDKAIGELEWRIGDEIAQHLTQEQLDDFEAIEDEDDRLEWLEKAYPPYKKIVHKHYDKMMKEIFDAPDKAQLIQS